MPETPDISVVIPIFNEEQGLPVLRERLSRALEGAGLSWEVIFSNDGSRDKSLDILKEAADKDPRFKIVNLSRNFGHQPAVSAGLARARGRAVVMMDGDLQDPPELVADLVASWKQGNEVVLAVRRTRADKGLRRLAFDGFYRFFRFLSDVDMSVSAGIFGLMDRRVVDELGRLDEHNRYLPGLRQWVGFRQGIVFYDRAERFADAPRQTFGRLVRYGLDAIFSFSYKPLRLASLMGALVWFLTGLYAVVLVLARLLEINVVPGFTTSTAAILLLGGLQLLCVGILGEYLGRVYDEVKRRPLFIEREFIDLSKR